MKRYPYMLILLLCALCMLSIPTLAEGTLPSTPDASVIPTPASTPAPDAAIAPTPFTIAWFGDTQTAAYNEPSALAAMGAWVAENYTEKNIVRVVQTGDLVDSGKRQKQWDAFYGAYDAFAGKVPYLAINGNHDIGVKEQNYDYYLQQRFLDELPERQKFKGGLAVYDLFSAGGTDFILAGVGWGAVNDAAPWLRSVLWRYHDRVCIFFCHGYFHPRYGLYEDGPDIHDQIIARCPNIRLILCGHYRGTAFQEEVFDDGGNPRLVNAMMLNFQGYLQNNAQMRLLTFDPASRSIYVETFNALNGRTYRDDTKKVKEFTLENAF